MLEHGSKEAVAFIQEAGGPFDNNFVTNQNAALGGFSSSDPDTANPSTYGRYETIIEGMQSLNSHNQQQCNYYLILLLLLFILLLL